MRGVVGIVMLALFVATAVAQLKPGARAGRPVSDPSMVVDDRGTQLEVLPAQRAEPQLADSGKHIVHLMFQTNPGDRIGPDRLGVVFNHAMQLYGYFTGEISFKMKPGAAPLGSGSYPGFTRLTGNDVYLVVGRTPSEYVELIKRLKRRNDVEWVEPIVIYGAPQVAPEAR